jgi:thioredoxin reductase (NADPH)
LDGILARDNRGFILTGRDLGSSGTAAPWPLGRDPHALETSMPGVFAAGDTRTGSIKRVASAVGEGSMAVQLIHQYLAELG